MNTPRIVRTTQSFFEALDATLPQERTAAGVPSTHDFLATEFETIRQKLGTAYEQSTLPWNDDEQTRVFNSTGTIVAEVVILTRLAGDGAVELLWIGVTQWPTSDYD